MNTFLEGPVTGKSECSGSIMLWADTGCFVNVEDRNTEPHVVEKNKSEIKLKSDYRRPV